MRQSADPDPLRQGRDGDLQFPLRRGGKFLALAAASFTYLGIEAGTPKPQAISTPVPRPSGLVLTNASNRGGLRAHPAVIQAGPTTLQPPSAHLPTNHANHGSSSNSPLQRTSTQTGSPPTSTDKHYAQIIKSDAETVGSVFQVIGNISSFLVASWVFKQRIESFVRRVITREQLDPLEIFCFQLENEEGGKRVVLAPHRLGKVNLRDVVGSDDSDDVGAMRGIISAAQRQAFSNGGELPFLRFRRGSVANQGSLAHRVLTHIADEAITQANRNFPERVKELCRESHAKLRKLLKEEELKALSEDLSASGEISTPVLVIPVHDRIEGRTHTRLYIVTLYQLASMLLAPGEWIDASQNHNGREHKKVANERQMDRIFEAAVALVLNRFEVAEQIFRDQPDLLAKMKKNAESFQKILLMSPSESLRYLEDISKICNSTGEFPESELTPTEQLKLYEIWSIEPTRIDRMKASLTRIWGPSLEDAIGFIDQRFLGTLLKQIELEPDIFKKNQMTRELRGDLIRSAKVILRRGDCLKGDLDESASCTSIHRIRLTASNLVDVLDDVSGADNIIRVLKKYCQNNFEGETSEAASDTVRNAKRPLGRLSEYGYRALSFFGALHNPAAVKFFSRGGEQILFKPLPEKEAA